MAHIEKSVIINAPLEKVFHYTANPATMHEWISGLIESRDLPDGPVSVGTTWIQVIRLAGKNIEMRRQVTVYEPPHKLVWEGDMVGGKATFINTFEPVNDKTKFTIIMDYTLPGSFMGQFADKLLVERIADRDVAHNTVTLKTILESGETNTSS